MEEIRFRVSSVGFFDSAAFYPRLRKTKPRVMERFFLEYFPQDSPGKTVVDGKTYSLKKGTFLCIKPGSVRHSILPFCCEYVHLETEDSVLLKLLRRLPDVAVLPETGPIEEIFRELLQPPRESLAEQVLWEQSLTCRLLLLLAGYFRDADKKDVKYSSYRKEMVLLEAHIRSHLDGDLSLARLAGEVGLSTAHFHRVFCEYFGKTPCDYVFDCRLAAAKAKLAGTDLSVSQIAAECGFSSQAYFNYRFREKTGLTPKDYRRKMLSAAIL